MSVLFPIFYLLGGLLVGRYFPSIRDLLSSLLTKALIPYVIVYNILTYQDGTAFLTIFSIIFCCLLFFIRYLLSHDKLEALTFSYLNIGWLGLPLAIAIFGDTASRIIIATYIGSSIFGNIASVAVMQEQSNWKIMISKALMSPPVLALVAGLVLRSFPIDLAGFSTLKQVYNLTKHLMSVMGMCILGTWLYGSCIRTEDVKASIPIALIRVISGSAIISTFITISRMLEIDIVMENIPVLFILPLLPPAANIVVLETYYRGTGHSASMIASGTLISLVFLSLYSTVFLISSRGFL